MHHPFDAIKARSPSDSDYSRAKVVRRRNVFVKNADRLGYRARLTASFLVGNYALR